jgi:pimeloyl-ACP methyl ester carboxylesterase
MTSSETARAEPMPAAPADLQSFRTFFYKSFDGLKLAARIYDAPEAALPLICLAGISRNSRDFSELAPVIAADARKPRRVIAFDYRGRGASGYDPNPQGYTIQNELRDLFDGLAALDIKRSVFFGTSRGGLLTMIAAAMRPELVAAAVLNDVGPEVDPAGLAEIRGYLGKNPSPADWPAAIATLKRIHEKRFTALSEEDWDVWARMSYAERDGRPHVDYDRALVAAFEPPPRPEPGTEAPNLWSQFRKLAEVPMLVLRGANSALFTPAIAEAMAAVGSRVKLEVVLGQGHPVQLRGAVNQRIAAWLSELPE